MPYNANLFSFFYSTSSEKNALHLQQSHKLCQKSCMPDHVANSVCEDMHAQGHCQALTPYFAENLKVECAVSHCSD